MSRARRLTAALALTGALFTLPACASSVDPIERLGRKAAEKVSPHPARVARARSEPSYGTTSPGRAFFRPCPPLTPRGRELALRLTEC
ncbi:hypothetical protein ACFU3J_04610 [Streptomyces sp. NPDC057411]|uniref:hypothetical protein n=1 Tax=unclassified Streptomyces TaxID=2593676 RepID=UPI003625400D